MSRDYTEITVVGDDDTGLIARVTTLLFERDINIEDLDQAVRDGVFRMTMHVDTDEMSCSEADLRAALRELGEELGQDVQVRFPADRETRTIAVLVTKESHCLEALLEAWADGQLGADIEVVVGNHDDLRPLAEQYGLDFHDVSDKKGGPRRGAAAGAAGGVRHGPRRAGPVHAHPEPGGGVPRRGRIIDVHPSLPPAFSGAEAYR